MTGEVEIMLLLGNDAVFLYIWTGGAGDWRWLFSLVFASWAWCCFVDLVGVMFGKDEGRDCRLVGVS
jgi:hypothetical protein